MLSRFCLLFTDDAQHWDVRHVDTRKPPRAHLVGKLPQGLDEGSGLDVTHGTAKLDEAHIGLVGAAVDWDATDALEPRLDRVGDVRHHLHGFAQVVSAPLPFQHRGVDLAGGHVGLASQVDVEKAFIVAQIEVGLSAVVRDKHLPVLEGRHGAGVNVEVGVYLDRGDTEAATLEEDADGRRRDAFAKARDNAAWVVGRRGSERGRWRGEVQGRFGVI